MLVHGMLVHGMLVHGMLVHGMLVHGMLVHGMLVHSQRRETHRQRHAPCVRVCVCDTYVCIVCIPNKLSLFLFLHVHNPHAHMDPHALYALSHTWTGIHSMHSHTGMHSMHSMHSLTRTHWILYTPEEWSSEAQKQAPRGAPQPPKTCMYPRHWLTKCFDGICVKRQLFAPRGGASAATQDASSCMHCSLFICALLVSRAVVGAP
jgi:hypothetical protein